MFTSCTEICVSWSKPCQLLFQPLHGRRLCESSTLKKAIVLPGNTCLLIKFTSRRGDGIVFTQKVNKHAHFDKFSRVCVLYFSLSLFLLLLLYILLLHTAANYQNVGLSFNSRWPPPLSISWDTTPKTHHPHAEKHPLPSLSIQGWKSQNTDWVHRIHDKKARKEG